MKITLLALMNIFLCSRSFSGIQKKECHIAFKQQDLCAHVEFLRPANRKTDSKFKLYFTDTKGSPKMPGEDPEVFLWMVMGNGHGHGTEKVTLQRNKDHYLVENAWFLMLGEWSINVKIKKDNKDVGKGLINICLEKDSSKNSFGKCK